MLSNFLLNTATASQAYFVIKFILVIIVLLGSVGLILLIMSQDGNSSGIGALGGSSETFLSKNKGKTKENLRKRRTIVLSVALGVILIALAILSVFPF